jgi:hypothetical protein
MDEAGDQEISWGRSGLIWRRFRMIENKLCGEWEGAVEVSG